MTTLSFHLRMKSLPSTVSSFYITFSTVTNISISVSNNSKTITERWFFTQGVLKLWNSFWHDIVDAKIWVQEEIEQIHERKKNLLKAVKYHLTGCGWDWSWALHYWMPGEIAVNNFLHLCAYLGVWWALKWGRYQWDGPLDWSNMDVLLHIYAHIFLHIFLSFFYIRDTAYRGR